MVDRIRTFTIFVACSFLLSCTNPPPKPRPEERKAPIGAKFGTRETVGNPNVNLKFKIQENSSNADLAPSTYQVAFARLDGHLLDYEKAYVADLKDNDAVRLNLDSGTYRLIAFGATKCQGVEFSVQDQRTTEIHLIAEIKHTEHYGKDYTKITFSDGHKDDLEHSSLKLSDGYNPAICQALTEPEKTTLEKVATGALFVVFGGVILLGGIGGAAQSLPTFQD